MLCSLYVSHLMRAVSRGNFHGRNGDGTEMGISTREWEEIGMKNNIPAHLKSAHPDVLSRSD